MQLDKQLYDEINAYCKLNSLKTRDFIHTILKEAFLKEKYGDIPFAFNKKTEHITSEQIIEEKPNVIVDDMADMINTVVEMNKKMQEVKSTPIIPIQTLGTDDIQIITEPQISFEKDENKKPKKKRTLK